MDRKYTEEEVTAAINATAMIANQVGDPESMSDFLSGNVPNELHTKILAACFGSRLFGGMKAALGSMMDSMMENYEEERGTPSRPKDITEMTSEELDSYIDQKLKEKREGK